MLTVRLLLKRWVVAVDTSPIKDGPHLQLIAEGAPRPALSQCRSVAPVQGALAPAI